MMMGGMQQQQQQQLSAGLVLQPFLSSGANAGAVFEQHWMSSRGATVQLMSQGAPGLAQLNAAMTAVCFHGIASQELPGGQLKAYYMGEAVGTREACMAELVLGGGVCNATLKVSSGSPQSSGALEALVRRALAGGGVVHA